MGFISNFLSSVKKSAKWVIGFFTGSHKEDEARKIKKIIRNNKKDIDEVRKKNNILIKTIHEKKKSNEFLRRGIINTYYQAQIDLIKSIIPIIKEIQSETYTKLKSIQHNLHNQKSVKIPDSYHLLNDQLHNEIKQSKLILSDLEEKKKELIHLSRMLMDKNYEHFKPHEKLGSKKLLAEIISAQNLELEDEYSEKQIIDVGELTLSLDKKCKSCKSYVSGIMNYCFVCGEEVNADIDPTMFSRLNKTDLTCDSCHSPILNNWNYCPNCGEEFDPYSLKKYVNIRS